MANIISIILRAVCLGFLSSFSKAFCTWQKSHSTPSEAAMNCMVGKTWSAGTPLSTWIFLNCSSAFLVVLVALWRAEGCGLVDRGFAAASVNAQATMAIVVDHTTIGFRIIVSLGPLGK